VIVGGGGGWTKATQAGHILTSADGVAWKSVSKQPFRVSPVLATERGFVGSMGKTLLASKDGETWTEGSKVELPADKKIPNFCFRKGAAGNGIALLIGDGGEGRKLTWSVITKDGSTIDSFNRDLPHCKGIAFGAGLFVLSGNDGLHVAKDGVTWEKITLPGPDETLRSVVWDGQRFVLSGAKRLFASNDGKTWQVIGKAPPGWIAAAGPPGMIALNWGSKGLSYSADGKDWKPVTQPEPARQMESVTFVPGK
jgi:hypothetical protein